MMVGIVHLVNGLTWNWVQEKLKCDQRFCFERLPDLMPNSMELQRVFKPLNQPKVLIIYIFIGEDDYIHIGRINLCTM